MYSIPVGGADTVVAAIDSTNGRASVQWFSIEFVGPRTAAGIGVGATMRNVRSEYAKLEADENEGAVYVWPVPDQGVSLGLAISRNALRDGWRQQPGFIPDSARVKELLVRAVVASR